MLGLSGKVYNYINLLRSEFRVLRRPFVFNNNDYLIFVVFQSQKFQKKLESTFGVKVQRRIDRSGNLLSTADERPEMFETI